MGTTLDPQKERELVEQAKQSLKAFDQLYEHYLPRIYGFVFNRTRSKMIAEDVVSQTFMKAMTKIKTFQYRGFTFGAWLYRIAHNSLMDYYRKHPNVKPLDVSRTESEDNVDHEAERMEKQQIILEALQKLPKQYQQVLSLKYFEELTNDEMAQVLGCRKGTLAVKLHRSLRALQKVLEKDTRIELST